MRWFEWFWPGSTSVLSLWLPAACSACCSDGVVGRCPR